MQKEKQCFELYIHIPFCLQKCRYCDFLSYPAGEQVKKQYVDLLCREIKVRSAYFQEKSVSTIFIGGGTPSCLPKDLTRQILTTVFECFAVDEHAEITMEVNPGTVDFSKLQTYRQLGINRLSIGLQSTSNEMLKVLGRIHTVEDFEKTYEDARRAGFTNISMDLMSALPGQTMAEFKETLEKAVQWKPEHISCYSLIIEEGTLFYEMQNQMTFPDEDEDREMYAMTERILNQYGYERYEISNYARQGYESIHNSGYWTRVPYLGLGLGAASLIEEKRFSNPRDMEAYENMILAEETKGFSAYLNQESVAWEHLTEGQADTSHAQDFVTVLSREDQMEEFMFLGLRMMKGISKTLFSETFGTDIEKVYGPAIDQLSKDGLLRLDGDTISLTQYGIDISNYVFSQFLF